MNASFAGIGIHHRHGLSANDVRYNLIVAAFATTTASVRIEKLTYSEFSDDLASGEWKVIRNCARLSAAYDTQRFPLEHDVSSKPTDGFVETP
ncbi:MAG: hypothetical protein ACJ72H_09660 [Candidatus Sulfotelmatobacter sp.]|jgi:hypothetical protein